MGLNNHQDIILSDDDSFGAFSGVVASVAMVINEEESDEPKNSL